MKVILCLLAVLCAVNAKSLQGYLEAVPETLQNFGQQVVDKLTEAEIDVEALTAELIQAAQAEIANGKTPVEIATMAVGYVQHGCENGFDVEGDLDLQNTLNAFREQGGCGVLEALQDEAMALLDAAGDMANTLGEAAAAVADADEE